MKIRVVISLIIMPVILWVFGGSSFYDLQTGKNAPMILIPGGKFEAGIAEKNLTKLKKKYKTRIKKIDSFFKISYKTECAAFYIDKFEVTNAEFLDFLSRSKYNVKSTHFDKKRAAEEPNFPVNNIGWEDAKAYAKFVNKRLPSEQEWERAAKGIKNNLWPWGNVDNGDCYNGYSQGYLHPVEVGSFPEGKSEFGVLDMSGNVYEMTTGRWYGEPCMKGGSYLNQGFYTMCAFRWAPDDTINGARWLGFRCVKDVSAKK